MQTSEQIGEFSAALAAAQAELKNPLKNREVTVTPRKRQDGSQPPPYKFKYATFDAILEMARPILGKHSIAIVQTVANQGDVIMVTTRLMHSSGQWVEDVIGGKVENVGLQGMGAAISYLKRYALTAMLGVAADDDDDGNSADGNLADVRDRQPAARGKAQVQRGATAAKPESARIEPDAAMVVTGAKDAPDFLSKLVNAFVAADTVEKVTGINDANAPAIERLRERFPELYADASRAFFAAKQRILDAQPAPEIAP